jgi:sulfatase maturation enzyme AslB (radical SAM superfamily)
MCNPRSSIRWIPDWQKVKDNIFEMTPEMADSYRRYDWYRSAATLEQLRQQLPTLRHLHFAGGEPLIVPEMLSFLRASVESGHSRHIELTYNTNLTKIPAEAKDLWPHFGGVKLLCSIDGVGRVNDFIRHPSHWDSIDRNLRDLEENHAKYGLVEVLIMCTVQVYNVFRLGELYDYLADNFRFVTQVPYLVDLHFPDYFRTQILPAELKAEALSHLKSLRERTEARIREGLIPERHRVALVSLDGAINFLGMEDRSDLVPRFVTVTESMDALRGQSTFGLLPELAALRDGVTRA